MGRVYTDATFIGTRASRTIRNILVDTGADYSIAEEALLKGIRAVRVPGRFRVKLANGKTVVAKAYAVSLRIRRREAPVIVLTFNGAERLIGLEALERLRLKVNPVTRKLESMSPGSIVIFDT